MKLIQRYINTQSINEKIFPNIYHRDHSKSNQLRHLYSYSTTLSLSTTTFYINITNQDLLQKQYNSQHKYKYHSISAWCTHSLIATIMYQFELVN